MAVRNILSLFKKSVAQFSEDEGARLGAALAYYGLFAISPLLIIAIAIAGVLFGQQAAQGQIVSQIKDVVGAQAATTIEQVLNSSRTSGTGLWATVAGIAMLIFGATSFCSELQGALNTIWKVKPRPDRGWLGMIRDRFISFTLVLVVGALLIASLVLTTTLAALTALFPSSIDLDKIYFWQVVNSLTSFAFIALLFAVIYKYLPDAKISWRDVWIGAAVTSLLFTAGKYLIGVYLAHSSVTSPYGAAGSVVLVLLWVYYSTQILLFGAEFTRACATGSGSPLVPKKNAVVANAPAKQLP